MNELKDECGVLQKPQVHLWRHVACQMHLQQNVPTEAIEKVGWVASKVMNRSYNKEPPSTYLVGAAGCAMSACDVLCIRFLALPDCCRLPSALPVTVLPAFELPQVRGHAPARVPYPCNGLPHKRGDGSAREAVHISVGGRASRSRLCEELQQGDSGGGENIHSFVCTFTV